MQFDSRSRFQQVVALVGGISLWLVTAFLRSDGFQPSRLPNMQLLKRGVAEFAEDMHLMTKMAIRFKDS